MADAPALRTLENDRLRLTIVPEAGASISEFALRRGGDWLPVMRPTPPDALAPPNASRMSSFVLAPWSNRVGGAHLRFAGSEYPLRPNTADGHAIHGDVRKRPFTVTEASPSQIIARIDSRHFADFNFPFPLACEVIHTLREDGLDLTLGLRNEGALPMPAGFGIHPYFPREPAGEPDDPVITLRAAGVYAGLVPDCAAGTIPPALDLSCGRPTGVLDLDHCFAGWSGTATIDWPASRLGLDIQADAIFSHAVVYVPAGQPFLAVEPVSHANNGFTLHEAGVAGCGIRVLQPGEEMRGTIRFRVRLA